ncbi:MAG: right-handed parallel beta-helix repeat-containing protein [Verrucomicrobia bacterium]|nr:right-handed parallel beta-helix repeat-containing protein [Verrucomicrobiota bacterium]
MKEQQTICLPAARWFVGLAICILVSYPLSAFSTVVNLSAGVTGAEIQKALDQLPAEGGEVVLAAGRYEIRQPIVLNRDRQTLRGSGLATVLWLVDGANCPVVLLGSAEANPTNIVTGLRLADLTIDGNRARQSVETWPSPVNNSYIQNNGVMIQAVADSTVERVVAAHCRSGGLVTANGVRHLTVSDFEAFDNEFDGLACYRTEESVFTKMNLHDNQAAGISLDLAFNHNIISESVLAGNDLGIFMRYSSGNVFQDLIIRQNRNDGVFMAQAGGETANGWTLTPGTECANNTFAEMVVSDCGGAAFRANDASCVNNSLRDAEFSNNTRGGLVQAAAGLVKTERVVER